MESLISNFYLSVAAHTVVWADPSLRYTSMLLGHWATNQQTLCSLSQFDITFFYSLLCAIFVSGVCHSFRPPFHSTVWNFFFFFFFFFAFPSNISGVHHFWVRFLCMWPFFNPTIKLVTFRLRGWCVLGVFLLPAFTRLGHERQDLLSPCDEIHVCTD